MHKEMKKFAKENEFLVERKKDIVYGQKNGFFFVIYQMPVSIYSHRVQIWAKPKRGEAKPAVSDCLHEWKEGFAYLLNVYFSGEKLLPSFKGRESGMKHIAVPSLIFWKSSQIIAKKKDLFSVVKAALEKINCVFVSWKEKTGLSVPIVFPKN